MQDSPFSAPAAHGQQPEVSGPRTVDLPPLYPLFADVMAAALLQLAYATLPPRRPDLVAIVLDEAGLLPGDHPVFEADDLEEWQPCLLTLRVEQGGELAAGVNASHDLAVAPLRQGGA